MAETQKVIHNRVAELVAIKERKEGRRISQRALAKESGIAFSTVASWYRNEGTRRDDDIILAFMRYFGCTLNELLVVEEVEVDDLPEYETHLLTA